MILLLLTGNVQVISQFDTPNSFQPVKTFYNKDKYEPTTEQTFVSGPPLGRVEILAVIASYFLIFGPGDDFVERYQKMIRNSQKKSQLSFEGLLPDDLIERRKRKHQDPPVPAFYQIKSPVTLDFPSASFESFDFNPNGGWKGEKATGLAQVPKPNKIKRQPVTLDYISPSTGTFSPNNNWFGEAETGLLTSYPNHLLPKRNDWSQSGELEELFDEIFQANSFPLPALAPDISGQFLPQWMEGLQRPSGGDRNTEQSLQLGGRRCDRCQRYIRVLDGNRELTEADNNKCWLPTSLHH